MKLRSLPLFASLILFCLPATGADTPKAAPSSAGKEVRLPSAKDVIARYVKAIGGRDAMVKHTSQRAQGKFEIPAQNVSGEIEIYAAKPDKLFVKVNITGFGEVLSGYDGKIAFSMDPATGPKILEGKMRDQIKDQADFLAVLHEEKNYKSMAVQEQTVFEGQDCYKLKLVKTSGDETIEYYDIKTGLQAGYEMNQETPAGPLQVSALISDYTKYGDMLLPAKMTQKMAGFQQVITLTAVEFDKVPESKFELPDAIKGLAGTKTENKQ